MLNVFLPLVFEVLENNTITQDAACALRLA
jgi:hypothetical protein